MLKLPDTLKVLYRDTEVGTLSMTPDKTRCVFEYNKNWLAEGFSISPVELPLRSGLLLPRSNVFYGNFGIFEDSMPDGYGHYLLERVLKKYGMSLLNLTPVERLSFVGRNGMGALQYVPETSFEATNDFTTLDQMQKDALDVLSEKDLSKAGDLYLFSGNSGGCRPKCLWKDDNGSWLVKFRHIYDPEDSGVSEYRILKLAEKCGIEIPEIKLFNGKYLGSKRFDIASDGTRLHVATASALLCESIRLPMMDYRKLVRFTKILTGDSGQAQEIFRRMIFNYEIGNNDDHAKNFSFIYDGEKWRCSPAYDITECREANNGFHSSLANNKENPTDEDFVVIASEADVSRTQAQATIRKIREIVKDSPAAKP